jgi:AcrR family transcriptional regulator
VQRRVARTKAAIEDAFVQLVLERGYGQVTVEDITDRADLARATFYAHYPNKEAVQFSVFNRLTADLVQRLAPGRGMWCTGTPSRPPTNRRPRCPTCTGPA